MVGRVIEGGLETVSSRSRLIVQLKLKPKENSREKARFLRYHAAWFKCWAAQGGVCPLMTYTEALPLPAP